MENTFKGSKNYVASPELMNAVNIAMALKKPLLIKGEPGTGKTVLAEAIAKSLGKELIIWNITRQTQTTLSVAPTKKITKECRFIEQYLDEHFKEDITLQTLSDLTYLNKYYLVHAFKNYKGVSPINYLIEKRISEAKHLLGTTNFPIAKIASVVGFSSQSYFSQVFRKETGLSPNKYRKSMDSQNEAGGLI